MNDVNKITTDWLHLFGNNGCLSVDVFFLISGILVCYNFLCDRHNGVKFNLFHFYLRRYIRMTPMYALPVLIYGTLSKFSPPMPLLNLSLGPILKSCNTQYWQGLAYVGNYFSIDRLCDGGAWTLFIIMQLFWLSPLILFSLWRAPRHGKTIMCVLMFVGIGITFMHSYINEVRHCSFMHLFPANFSQLNRDQYFSTHHRFTPWLVGIGLGYQLHKMKLSKVQLSRGVLILGWSISACLLILPWICGHYLMQPERSYDRVAVSLFLAVYRPAFAAGFAWFIYVCAAGYGGIIASFLSSPVFQVMSRLNYVVYMTHSAVLGAYLVNSKTTRHYNDIVLLVASVGITGITYLLAIGVHLAVEIPPINLCRELLGKPEMLEKKKDSGVTTVTEQTKKTL